MNKIIKYRIDSLDGLRAISIFLVLFGHAFKPQIFDLGNLGVKIFFIISSYLIVGILYNDIQKNRFSIKTFYFKRILRTFPAFYFYLISIFIFLNLIHIFDWEQFWRAPIYLTNYQPRSDWKMQQWFVGHSWSLAVEEQFYIIIAILFLFLNKNRITVKKLLYILFLIVLTVPIIRICYLYFNFIPNVLSGSIHRCFETVADSLAIGGIIFLTESEIISSKYFLWFKNKTTILIILILALMVLNSPIISVNFGLKPRYIYNLFGLTVINFSIAGLILIYKNFALENRIARFLNFKFMTTIGLWSYSIYLWQQVWLYRWEIPLYIKFIGLFACAITSYYFIELPFLKIRDNYLKKKK